MIRKRNRYTRERAKRGRPKTPAPTTGWLLTELAEFTQLSLTTLRYYVQQGLIRPTEFRGTLTRYSRRELVRLLGIVRLKSERKTTLAEIQRKLDALSESDLESWITERPLPPAVAAALVLPASPADASREEPSGERTLEAEPVGVWQRIIVMPGFELMLRSDAAPAAHIAAERLREEFRRK